MAAGPALGVSGVLEISVELLLQLYEQDGFLLGRMWDLSGPEPDAVSEILCLYSQSSIEKGSCNISIIIPIIITGALLPAQPPRFRVP